MTNCIGNFCVTEFDFVIAATIEDINNSIFSSFVERFTGSSAAADVNDNGDLTFSGPQSTPEPGSLALMLLGLGLVFAMRKRFSGLQLAS